MPNPVTDYKLAYTQGDVERVARYIALVNPGVPYYDAYQKAVRTLARASGEERKLLR
ncbi:hypothetical protein PGN35_000480 [Nodosilinea sp. PGN35]|uniref:hypothetical protein n=1 Tax=Nodosilinea sp. PGN35 TaxID=3020489 RepID=UPI0023B323DE|nr:hypothetical protein [Nodosilinea sp. TSF1-S3]MDF0369110.1 hypothetical protein [Nodosilinea sp. TSF1-S3]